MKEQGTIRLYKENEKYGFIVNPKAKPGDKSDFHFRKMDLRTENWIPQKGEDVTYELVKTDKGWNARNVSKLVATNKTIPTRPSANPSNPSPSQAHAPFNFVPLNETVVPGEDAKGTLTGFIELEITAETPLYVRNTLTVEKYGEKEALREENPKKPYLGNPDFFQPGGLFRLPGSSLRGMVRTLVEIIGHGSFRFFDDKATLSPSCSNTVANHVPSELTAKGLDLAKKIFGDLNSKPSRVFFEDAFLENGNPEKPSEKRVPKILSTPKPAACRLYLEQSAAPNLCACCRRIRGYKLYWHKSARNWEDTRKSPAYLESPHSRDTQHTILCPMEAQSVFSGRIRFEGLTSVELGCLLFALDLPEGCCHKIGMGKPLGLGSIHVEPKLFLSDRKKRYATLEREWQSPPPTKEQDEYKSRFAQYLLKLAYSRESDSETSWKELWKTDRMKELKRLLAFEPGSSPDGRPKDREIQYMSRRDFQPSSLLPRPTEVG